ncbi:vacuolar amino acid transporter 4 [Lentinula aff. detonsa]|uniref:Vacuolar amino acid transporter 4 n=1 Tax=Lentinula aff. detonsa TaxID=2804958 RepID=A0AA38NJN6_9AGAR|nr:vacuolar amino acid transporter 4 [Lentinula aff. detonsa]
MSSPSKPLGIPRRGSQSLSATPAGTPDLRALKAQVISGTPPVGLSIPPPNIPPRTSSPAPSGPFVEGTPASLSTARIQLAGPSRTESPLDLPVDLDDLPDEEKAKILRRHLVSREERERERIETQEATPSFTPEPTSQTRRSSGSGRIAREDSEPFPVPYAAPGADVTHDIYKWHLNAQRQARRVRSASFSAATRPAPDPAFEHIHEPGGFRRNYVLLRAGNEDGNEEPRVFVNNFIDFLFLFGHFAGEDLEEEDEDNKDEDDLEYAGPSTSVTPVPGFGDLSATESSPLLGNKPRMSRSRSRSRRRAASMSTGNATVGQAVLMLLKGFVGTGVLFLGKAFMNGGILFSSLLFIFIAVVSLHSFLLLVRAKLVVPGSFGDIGGALYGPWMRHLILSSIVLSQIGFVGAYMIFVSENLQAFVSSVTNCVQYVPVKYFILIQTLIFLPFSLLRDIVKLSTTALVADAFILVGLVYIFSSEVGLVIDRGARDVQMFNPKNFSLFVGTAVFSFEGIGLIVPIVDSMREPHKFPTVLTGVMAFLLILFGGAGALAYLTFGSDIQTVVLVNLNEVHPGSRMLQVVQFFYSLAILLSVPLQLFPAIRIMENGLFTRSGKADTRVKWMKNIFRFATVIVTACVSLAGAKDLDKFVAFVGCFACVPLCYVYPAMLHYRACAHTRKKKLADIAMIVFGLVAAVFTTVQTIKLMIEPEVGGSPIGECDPPRV